MKELELMLETAKAISDDKIINAVAIYIRVEAISNFVLYATLSACAGYAVYRLIKALTR